jgi:hypothetical protein
MTLALWDGLPGPVNSIRESKGLSGRKKAIRLKPLNEGLLLMSQDESSQEPSRALSESDEDRGELMYVRCCLCGEWLDVKPGKLNWVSHGLCPPCLAKEMARIGQFLEERRKQRQ